MSNEQGRQPSRWRKDRSTTVRINSKAKHILEAFGISAQKALDMAVDAILWIRDDNGELFTPENHPLLTRDANTRHAIRPPVVPIPALAELLDSATAIEQAGAVYRANAMKTSRLHDNRDKAHIRGAVMRSGMPIHRDDGRPLHHHSQLRPEPTVPHITEAEYMTMLAEDAEREREFERIYGYAMGETPPTHLTPTVSYRPPVTTPDTVVPTDTDAPPPVPEQGI